MKGFEVKRPEELIRRNAELQSLVSRLSAATLRINESLDFDTVLQEVVGSARVLTASRYGVITILNPSNKPPDYVTSGMTDDERRALEKLHPDPLQVYKYLSELETPLRVDDYQSYIASLGFSDYTPFPVSAFLVAPIKHLGESLGTIYLGREEPGRRFNREDEETLVMFAAQAALVIANARRYRDEQQARTDLETLVDTSPVGVVVFDLENSRVTSLNREAKRIVGDLLAPDGSWEQLLSTLTYRRADGRETSLEEYTVYEALATGETVRAEEITVGLPDGRSVTALINATPIRSENGEITSFVVTLQDLAPMEEMERLRAEFLGMVSHELRTPLTSIRGSATTLLDEENNLDPAEMRQFFRIIVEQADHMRRLISDLLDLVRIDTGTLPVSLDPTDVVVLVDDAKKLFLSAGGRNQLDIDISPYLPQVMVDRRRIIQVLGNLLSNAARYSSESSPIGLAAVQEGVYIAVSVTDNGRGLSAEQLPHLFRKYTRIDRESRRPDLGGTGLGLSICKGIVEAHGGRITAESDGPGLGTRFTFTIPVAEEAATPTLRSNRRTPAAAKERTRVLTVDDDPRALRYIRHALTQAGYEPVVTADPQEVPDLIKEVKPHLVILDLLLPGTDGITVMQDILKETYLPVIFLSAYGQEENVTRALDMGALDYIVKPFSPSELAARIRAALRRQSGLGKLPLPDPYRLRDLAIEYGERRVTAAGSPVNLTPTEYAVLFELSINAGVVLTHEELLGRVWGHGHTGDSGLVRTIVNRLRRKLGDDAANPAYIFTQPRVGYRMAKGQGQAREP